MEVPDEKTKDEAKKPAAAPSKPKNGASKNATNKVVASPGKQSHLSELARQLRVMKAKNQTLTVEIGRLERQLRIVAETSGVSVAELCGTLQRACENEAYAELQSRLASLEAQLEEATLKHSKASEFDREDEAKKTANLQLRVGELEEAEGALRKEIGQLYKSQDEQAEEATNLKATNDQQAKEIASLKEQIDKLESQNKSLEVEVKSPVVKSKRKIKDPPAYQSETAEKKEEAPKVKAKPQRVTGKKSKNTPQQL